MIVLLRAFVWLRWRLLANSLRGGTRRDTMEQISRALAFVTPLALGAMSLGLIVVTAFVGFLGGRSAATGLMEPATVALILRGAVVVIAGIVLLFAIIVPSQTTMTRYNRLLLLPIPRRLLHGIEVAAGLADPWVIWMIPGVFAVALGLAVGGWLVPAAIAALAALVFVLTVAVLSVLASLLVTLLVRNRRRAELFTLFFVVGISLLSFLPALLAGRDDDRRSGERGRNRRSNFSVQQFEQSLPAWTGALPTELYGRTVLAAMQRDTVSATVQLAGLAGECLILYLLSGLVHGRLLATPEGGRRRTRGDVTAVSVMTLPGAGPRISAIAWAQARTSLRSVRGRLMVVLSGPMMAVLVLLVNYVERDEAWPAFLLQHGWVLLGASGIFALYALQAFTMNLFGADRAGLTLQFLAPVSDAELARGKVIGCLLMLVPALSLSVISVALAAPTGSPILWVAALLGIVSCFLWLSPVFVWLSALFPVAADMSKSGSGGNPHALPMFAGTFLVLLVALPGTLILGAGAFWYSQPVIALLAMIAWTLIAAAVAHPLVIVASRTISLRRENLAMVAQGK